MVILLVDATNLRRNLLFCSQIIDLKIPVVVALTMMDLATKKGIEIDVNGLERELGVSVVPVNPRKNKGMIQLKEFLHKGLSIYIRHLCGILYPIVHLQIMLFHRCDW